MCRAVALTPPSRDRRPTPPTRISDVEPSTRRASVTRKADSVTRPYVSPRLRRGACDAPPLVTRTRHTGADFEAGRVGRPRGDVMPGMPIIDARLLPACQKIERRPAGSLIERQKRRRRAWTTVRTSSLRFLIMFSDARACIFPPSCCSTQHFLTP